MDAYTAAVSYLPPFLRRAALHVSSETRDKVHEIRLRVGAPLTLSATNGEWWLLTGGGVTATQQPGLLFCTQEQIDECVLRLCDYSIHTHQEELREGFIRTQSGCRAGLGGCVVYENGQAVTMRAVSSVCLRISRRHDGCAADLLRIAVKESRVKSAVLCGPPSSGKTTLLRDAARILSEGYGGRKWRVSVIDERGELSVGDSLRHCDVLLGCRKAEGILRAVRTLAPQVVVFDEWGSAEECAAIEYGLRCGVAVLTSCHGQSVEDLWRRPQIAAVLENGGMDLLCELSGYIHPGEIVRAVETGDRFAEMDRSSLRGACGNGNRLLQHLSVATSHR